jgi:hypothetical protein
MRTLLVTCVDSRLSAVIEELEDELGIRGCDRLQVPGGPLALLSDGPQAPAMIAWIELLARHKDVSVVHLVSHQHCLAYQRRLGGFFHDEREVIERDLLAAKRACENAVYGLRVDCHLVPWLDDAYGGDYASPVSVT